MNELGRVECLLEETLHWWLNVKERSDFGDEGVDWSIILK